MKTAFLQGGSLERPVFIRPPKEVKSSRNVLWKLLKPVYGLQDASRKWFLRVSSEMCDLGFVRCPFEPALFIYQDAKVLSGLVILHVDDFLFAGTRSFVEEVMQKLDSVFTVGKHSTCLLKFTGINIQKDPVKDCLTLDQRTFFEEIEITHESNPKHNRPLTEDEVSDFRGALGQLQCTASQTRPDLSFYANSLACDVRNVDTGRFRVANKCLRRLKYSKDMTLAFPMLGEPENLVLEVFTDASFQNLGDGGSQGGFVTILTNPETGKCHPLAWASRKIKRIARSTLAAEILALQDGLHATIFLAQILEFITGLKLRINGYVDSKQLFESLYSSKTVLEKRLRVEISSIQELLQSGEVSRVNWVPTTRQYADCLTKKSGMEQNLVKLLKTASRSVCGTCCGFRHAYNVFICVCFHPMLTANHNVLEICIMFSFTGQSLRFPVM